MTEGSDELTENFSRPSPSVVPAAFVRPPRTVKASFFERSLIVVKSQLNRGLRNDSDKLVGRAHVDRKPFGLDDRNIEDVTGREYVAVLAERSKLRIVGVIPNVGGCDPVWALAIALRWSPERTT
jgi:hypothetical protein